MELKLGRSSSWLLPVAGGVIGAILYFLGAAKNYNQLDPEVRLAVLALFVVGGGVVGFILRSSTSFKFGGIEIELEPIRAERKAIEQRIEARQGAGLDIFNVIQLGLNQITEYYTINKSQARNSFRASMGAVIFGLLALSVGIALNYKQPQLATVSALSAIAGVLLQFIGGAYFHLYNRSLQQLNFFYETLVRLQDTMLAVQQVDQLESGTRDKARGGIITALMRTPVSVPRISEGVAKRQRRKPQATKTSS